MRPLSTKPVGTNTAMDKTFLLVDAHNAIFARTDLAALHRRNPAAAREKILRALERYQDAEHIRVVAVFDGGYTPLVTSAMSGAAGVQVIYSRAGQTADAIIEQLVVKYAGTRHITVATNDNLIRTAAIAAGASTLSIETLFGEIACAEKELGKTLERLRKKE